jgi:ABC-type hemin transport system ATPase subunit
MADRVVCLKDGRVDRIGAADEILTNSYMERLFDLPSGSL